MLLIPRLFQQQNPVNDIRKLVPFFIVVTVPYDLLQNKIAVFVVCHYLNHVFVPQNTIIKLFLQPRPEYPQTRLHNIT